MKRLIALTLAALLLIRPAAAEEVGTSAKACVVIDMDSGRILLENNAHQALPMASTTKIMTALLALEHCSPDEPVTAGRNAFGVPGTSIYLDLGETLSMEEMLHGLMIASGNDAAVAIAEHVGGSVDDFCSMMTARARELGCTQTVFLTPHGLPKDGHVTTAYELALITREAMQHDLFRTIVGTKKATIPWVGRSYSRVLNNKNALLGSYDGAMGVKTGYTRAAGRCLVTAAERDGMRVICVVLNCWDWFNESKRLLDAAFAGYRSLTIAHAGEQVRTMEVTGSGGESVGAVLGCDLRSVAAKGEWPAVEILLDDAITAPVTKGDVIGEMRLMSGDDVIGSAPLLADRTVAENTFAWRLNRIVLNWR